MKKRWGLLLGILLVIGIIVPVLASSYTAEVSVTESSGNYYVYHPFYLTLNNAYLGSNGYQSLSGLDQRITYNGVTLPSTVYGDKTYFVAGTETYPIQSNTILAQFSTGNDNDTMPLVVGSGGYVTTSDDSALEPSGSSNIFSCEFQSYENLTSIKTYVSKTGALSISKSGATVSASSNLIYTEDGTSSSSAEASDTNTRVGNKITSCPVSTISSVSIYLSKYGSPTGTGYMRVYKVSDGLQLGSDIGTIDVSTLTTSPVEYTFSTNSVSNDTVRDLYVVFVYTGGGFGGGNYVNAHSLTASAYTYARYVSPTWTTGGGSSYVKINVNNTITGTLTTSGEHIIKYYSTDGSTIKLDIDNSTASFASFVGIPNTTYNWIIYPDPYMNYYKFSINGVEKYKYEPTYMIGGTDYSGTLSIGNGFAFATGSGTTFTTDMIGGLLKLSGDTNYYTVTNVTSDTGIILDRAYTGTGGAKSFNIYKDYVQDLDNFTYVGVITRGVNYASTTISSLTSSDNPTVIAQTVVPSDLVQQNVSSGGMNDEIATQPDNIFTPWFTPWSDLTNIPLIGFFLIVCTVFLILVIVWTMKHTQNQLIGSIVLVFGEVFLYKLGVYQLWFVIVTFLICLAIVVYERRPVV